MVLKIIFLGNMFGGDDGIGPYLYKELKDATELRKFDILELGVIGFDLVSYVDENDSLIIVDAVYSEKEIGKVQVIDENDFSKDLAVVSQHDFGIEQTATILRSVKPKLGKISLIGINVQKTRAFDDKLSPELVNRIDSIKKEVLKNILELSRGGL